MQNEAIGKLMPFRIPIFVAIVAIFLTLALTSSVSAAGPGGTVGDALSDGLMGNEPNIIPFSLGDLGPSQVAPGSIGAGPNSVEGSGAPGPITCNGTWFGLVQLMQFLDGDIIDTTLPGNTDAPGMNVDCSDGGSPPHTP